MSEQEPGTTMGRLAVTVQALHIQGKTSKQISENIRQIVFDFTFDGWTLQGMQEMNEWLHMVFVRRKEQLAKQTKPRD